MSKKQEAMAVSADRDALLSALRHVGDVVESRNTIPILGNVLIEAAPGGDMTLTATNLDQQASVSLDAVGSGAITVDSGKMQSAVASLKPGQLRLHVDAGKLTINQGKARRTLPTLAASDFPRWTEAENVVSFRMPAAGLRRLLDAAHVAMSSEDVRYYLNGVSLNLRAGKLYAAATDGSRMVRADMAAPEALTTMPDVILPSKAVQQLRKLIAKEEGEISIALNADKIDVCAGRLRLRSKLIDGTFPDYENVLLAKFWNGEERSLTVARDALLDPIEAVAAVLAAEGDKIKVRGVTFNLKAGGEGHEVTGRDMAGAAAEEPLDAAYDGPAMRIGVNKTFAAAGIGIFAESATLTLAIEGERDPIRITSDKDPDLIAVLMPMHAHAL